MRAEEMFSRSVALMAGTRRWLRAAKMAWARRKLVIELASLDEYLLRDMGITRQDVTSVLADPALGDPTVRLAARAKEARRGRRASASEEQRWTTLLSEPDEKGATGTDRRAA